MSNEFIFGMHAVQSMLNHSADRIKIIKIQRDRSDKRIQSIIEQAGNHNIIINFVDRSVLDKEASGVHQGVLASVNAVAPLRETDLEILLNQLEKPALFLVLDGVTDPHNLGACFRTADAAGVDGIITPKDNAARVNATVQKVACGATNFVRWFMVTNLSRTLDMLKNRGVWIYGAGDDNKSSIYSVDFKCSSALVMGSEDKGIRRLTKEKCDYLVKIPMHGHVSSLNVSVATGIALFEVIRQRNDSH